MMVVESRIMSAQKEFDAECEKIQRQYEVDIDTAEKMRATGKADLADRLVLNITSKII